MDIHKPKPWHSLREFLKEYLIIVVGVLTALAAEQTVESLHTAHQARAAETRVREEAARSMALADEQIAASPCVAAELAKVRTLLSSSAPLPKLPRLRTPPFRPSASAEWDSTLRSGLHEHFTEPERKFLPLLVAGQRLMTETQQREREQWQRLATIEDYPRQLDAVTRESLLQTTVLAQHLDSDVAVVASQVIQNGRSAGLSMLQRDPDGEPTTHAAAIRAHGCPAWP